MAALLRILALLLALTSLPAPAPATSPLPDPAVVHANTVKSGQIGYREGYHGSGDDRLHYVEAGRGPLILFYHGFPSFWYSWFDQMELLKGRYRVVAVDALGAGRSAKPGEASAYRIERLAAQLDRLARHLAGKQRFILVGHDWGAALAFAYAQGYPHRLHGVVGMSAPPYNLFLDLVRTSPEQQARSSYMQRFRSLTLEDIAARGLPEQIWRGSYEPLVADGSLNRDEAALFRTALAEPTAINGGMNWYRANIPPFEEITAAHRWPATNPKIRVPAMLIWGSADRTFVDDLMHRTKANAADLKVVQLPGVGHWATMQRPAAANAALAEFVAKLRPSACRGSICT
jgi:pimeloyl-ACP methyl ester carboxylesterase